MHIMPPRWGLTKERLEFLGRCPRLLHSAPFFSFPNSVWERHFAKLRFASRKRNRVSRRGVPKRSLGTRETRGKIRLGILLLVSQRFNWIHLSRPPGRVSSEDQPDRHGHGEGQ